MGRKLKFFFFNFFFSWLFLFFSFFFEKGGRGRFLVDGLKKNKKK